MKTLHYCILSLLLLCTTAIPADAQARGRQQYREDIREYKHNYIVKKLNLTREQSAKFFDIYDKMSDELTMLNDEARAIEAKIYDAPEGSVTDLEYEMASKTLLEVKKKEAEIAQEYYPQLQEILTPQQLFELNKAERDFMVQLVRHQRRNNKK